MSLLLVKTATGVIIPSSTNVFRIELFKNVGFIIHMCFVRSICILHVVLNNVTGSIGTWFVFLPVEPFTFVGVTTTNTD